MNPAFAHKNRIVRADFQTKKRASKFLFHKLFSSRTIKNMAWNKYYIFVTNQEKTDFTDILPKLGLGAYKAVEETDLYSTNKPQTLFAGNLNGCLLLIHQDLVFKFYEVEQSETERRFIECFPNSEIAVLYSNETVYGFGYTIIQNGKRVRVNSGSDGELYYSFGESLPEEIAIFSQNIFQEEEIEEMREFEDLDEEEINQRIHFEACWRVPMRLTIRYLGQRIDEIDGENLKIIRFEK